MWVTDWTQRHHGPWGRALRGAEGDAHMDGGVEEATTEHMACDHFSKVRYAGGASDLSVKGMCEALSKFVGQRVSFPPSAGMAWPVCDLVACDVCAHCIHMTCCPRMCAIWRMHSLLRPTLLFVMLSTVLMRHV